MEKYYTARQATDYNYCCSASRVIVKLPLLPTRACTTSNSVRSRWSYYRCFGLRDLG